MNRKLNTILIFVLCSIASNIYAQNRLGQKASDLFAAQKWSELKEFTNQQLEIDTTNVFVTMKLRYLRTHALRNTGEVKESFLETEKLFNEYNDRSLVDTSMVKMMLNICQKLSSDAIRSKKVDIGVTAVKRALRLCQDRLEGKYPKESLICHNAATLHRLIDSTDLALKYLNQGKEAASRLEGDEKRTMISRLSNEEAIIYWSLNNLKMTKSIFTEELQQAIADSNYNLQTKFHTNLGITNQFLFDYGKSEYHFMKALEMNKLKKGERERDEYLVLYNLARVYGSLKKYEKAEAMLYKSIELSKKLYGDDSPAVAGQYLALGNTFAKRKRYAEARKYYNKNSDILKQNYGENSTKYTDLLSEYGATLILEGKLDEGIKYVIKSVKNREALNQKYDPKLSKSYMHLTSAYINKNDFPKALEALQKTTSFLGYEFGDSDFDKLDIPKTLIGPFYMHYEYLNSEVNNEKNDILDQVSELDNTVDSLVRYIKLNFEDFESRKAFVVDMKTLYLSRLELYSHLYESHNDVIAKIFDLSERSKNTFLYEAKAEKDNISNALTSKLYNQRQKQNGLINNSKSQLNKYLADSENQEKEIVDSLTKVLTSAQDDQYQLIQKIKKDHPGYYSYVYDYPIASIPDLQERLQDDEMLVVFVASAADQLAITISNSDKKLINLGSADTMDLAINEYIEYCRNPKAEPKFTYDLTSLLVEPLNLSKKKIHFILDDLLAMIPMETLMDENGNQLIINHDITYNYSATLMLDKEQQNNRGGDVLAMAPVFNDKTDQYDQPQKQYFADVIRSGNIIPLPGTFKEVSVINSLFGGSIFTEDEATKGAFFDNAKNKSIIHLATHGIINEIEPSMSGLIFNGSNDEPEELLVSEIIQLDLNADLVTLSACNTGSGKIINGEGVASLGRAFSYAGCANQVLSLWAVNDKSTTQLMTNYYQNISNGEGKSIALKNAKIEYLKNSPKIMQHPYYWAGFVYYGDDTPIQLSNGFGTMIWIGLGLAFIGILFFLFNGRKTN